MKPNVSMIGVLIAGTMFAVTVAMHEAARVDDGQDTAQGGTRLRANFLSIPHSDALEANKKSREISILLPSVGKIRRRTSAEENSGSK